MREELEKEIALYLAYELISDDVLRRSKVDMERISKTTPYPEMARDICDLVERKYTEVE